MNFLRTLGNVAGGMGNVYRIVFTGLLLYELYRFRFKKERHGEGHRNYPGNRGGRARGALGDREAP